MLFKPYARKFGAATWVLVFLAISILGAGQAHAQVAGATLAGTVRILPTQPSHRLKSRSRTFPQVLPAT